MGTRLHAGCAARSLAARFIKATDVAVFSDIWNVFFSAFQFHGKLLLVTPACGYGIGLSLHLARHGQWWSASAIAWQLRNLARCRLASRAIFLKPLFDGKTLTLLDKNVNTYAQIAAPGTVDQIIEELKDKHNRPLPASDILLGSVYDELIQGVYDAKALSREWCDLSLPR
jgi:hypothetical protein